MGDNKISEAVTAACSAFNATDGMLPSRMRAALEAALPHLQGEAVPVAWLIQRNGHTVACMSSKAGALQVAEDEVVVPVFSHPQPAELSEVSGDSGELPPLPEAYGEITYRRQAGYIGRVEGFTRNQMKDYARDALAATGKQQVGEVLGSREQFEAWIQGTSGWKKCAKRGSAMYLRTHMDGSYADFRVNDRWSAWQAAIACLQPVAAKGVDIGQFRDSVIHECLRAHAEWQGDLITYDEYLAAEKKRDHLLALIDGRDAGTGVKP